MFKFAPRIGGGTVKLPGNIQPKVNGKPQAPEHLAYISQAEAHMLKLMTDGKSNKTPFGPQSFTDPSQSYGGDLSGTQTAQNWNGSGPDPSYNSSDSATTTGRSSNGNGYAGGGSGGGYSAPANNGRGGGVGATSSSDSASSRGGSAGNFSYNGGSAQNMNSGRGYGGLSPSRISALMSTMDFPHAIQQLSALSSGFPPLSKGFPDNQGLLGGKYSLNDLAPSSNISPSMIVLFFRFSRSKFSTAAFIEEGLAL